jgi:hypothetical protein
MLFRKAFATTILSVHFRKQPKIDIIKEQLNNEEKIYVAFPFTAQGSVHSEAFHKCSFIIKFYVFICNYCDKLYSCISNTKLLIKS